MVSCTQNTNQTAIKSVIQPLVKLEKPLERLSPDVLSNLGRVNLFEPLIVIDTTQNTDTSTTAVTNPDTGANVDTTDPFQNIKLNGIFYGKKGKSVAILKTADDKASNIVALGESFPSVSDTSIKIKVSEITNNMVVLSSGKQKKVLKIDSLIGFKSSGTDSSIATTAPSSPVTNSPSTPAPTVSPKSLSETPVINKEAPLSGGLANHF